VCCICTGHLQAAVDAAEDYVAVRREATAALVLIVALTEARHPDRALSLLREAVSALGEPGGDDVAAWASLARMWHSIADHLTDLGRPGEAAQAELRATEARRRLAPVSDADIDIADADIDIAEQLQDAGLALARAGRWRRAVAALEQAAELYRGLDIVPDDARARLVSCLLNFAACMGDAGWVVHSAHLLREGLRVLAPLSEANATWMAVRASANHDLGACLARAGRQGQALQPSLEAVRIRRVLTATDLNQADQHRINLARSLANLGVRLSEAGRHVEALAATAESVFLRRHFPATYPHLREELYRSLMAFAQVRQTAGVELDDAAKALAEAEQLRTVTR
jgi:tetratricopeptide (TPR) repeat protein